MFNPRRIYYCIGSTNKKEFEGWGDKNIFSSLYFFNDLDTDFHYLIALATFIILINEVLFIAEH